MGDRPGARVSSSGGDSGNMSSRDDGCDGCSGGESGISSSCIGGVRKVELSGFLVVNTKL